MRWWRDGLPSAMRRASLAAAILAGLLGAAADRGAAADFDRIKAAAVREGMLTVWHNTPKQETTDALVALFDKRFGMNITLARVPVSGAQMSARLMTEKRGGKFTVDVFIADDRHLPFLVENGLVEKTDWAGLFAGSGKIDPALLKSAADNLIPDYVGYGLEFRHDIYGLVYNTKLVAEAELPRRWEDLADGKWNRKLAIDAGLSPLARLVPVIGRDAVLTLARKIVANRPVYADGQPAAAKKVVSGETPLGALSLSLGLEERGKGAPVALAFPEPQAIISQLIVYVAKDAPHPNLAKLWAAWLASEAMNSAPMIEEGILRAWPGAPGPFGDYFARHHLAVRRAASIAELEESNLIRKDLDAVVSAGR
jgi:iron(III) transport system substrate-binding protein